MTNRSVLAGDGIAYAGSKLDGVEQDHPHACTDGLVFLTYTVFDEGVGEEVERLVGRMISTFGSLERRQKGGAAVQRPHPSRALSTRL